MLIFNRHSDHEATDIPNTPIPTITIDIIPVSTTGHVNPSFESSWEGLPPSYDELFETDLKLPPPAYENIFFESKVGKNNQDLQWKVLYKVTVSVKDK